MNRKSGKYNEKNGTLEDELSAFSTSIFDLTMISRYGLVLFAIINFFYFLTRIEF